jgi:hypothetical protein
MSTQAQLFKTVLVHEDVVYTPDFMADAIVRHFALSGRILEPCSGDGAFLRHLPAAVMWCEIQKGKDFFEWYEQVDWIIGNPPYSVFADWLRHSFDVAENIVYLLHINKVFNSDNLLRQIYKYGGIKEIYSIGHGSLLRKGLGFALGAIHFQRNYKGDIKMSFREAIT